MSLDYLDSTKKQFLYYKQLGDKTIEQLSDEQLLWQYNPESNSIAIIVNHLCGNMLSRWTNFLDSDGEKEWRNRDAEFETNLTNKHEVVQKWNQGWTCFLDSLNALSDNDLHKTIYIRNMGHTVLEAINRQLAHYPYHIGQIVFIGKMLLNDNWTSLSIAKGKSETYNTAKFAQPKHNAHFTDEFINHKS